MCLMLYLATAGEQPCFETPSLLVEEVEPARESVRRWLSLPVVRFIGANTGCSCGFRHIKAEEPFDYHEGMFLYEDDRGDEADARAASLAALLVMIREYASRDGVVEILPVWDGDEAEPPLGAIDKPVDALQPATWFFIERFLYRVAALGT